MEFIGYIGLVIMGITLGLIGAGGSILTIPILVYLLRIPIVTSTTYSLFIVGFSAALAAIRYRRHIVIYNALLFAAPSILGVFLARYYIIPSLPKAIYGLHLDKLLVALLLIFIGFAGYFMIRKSLSYYNTETTLSVYKRIKIILIGFDLGVIMGILGAGGGFLIIPTLVILMGFNMQQAVPTSLFVITINSFVGFFADKHHLSVSDWSSLFKYIIYASIGMFVGIYLAKFIKGESLKKSFGYFVWVVGMGIFFKEFIF